MPACQSFVRPIVVALSSLALACGGGSGPTTGPSTTPPASPQPTISGAAPSTPPATGTPATVVTPTPSAAVTPGTSLTKADAIVLAYEQSGGVDYEIVQKVTNTGSGWVKPIGISTFTIFNESGAPLDFAAIGPRVEVELSLPSRIAVGETAYLLCNYFSDDFPLSAYQTAESDLLPEAVDGPATATLTIANARTATGVWGGLDVIADLTNPGTEPVTHADVGALFFDADGVVIGFTSGLIQDIGPGATKHVEVPGTFLFDGDKISDVMFFAQPWDI